MSLVQRRSKHFESAISICLLAILFLIAVVIFIRQSNYDLGRFGIQPLPTAPTDLTAATLALLVPDGFETLSEVETYNPENLYEKINGKAPLYLECGFKKLFTQRFVSQDDNSLWFELYIYDMATVKNAFSVFSVQKRADAAMAGSMDPQYAYRTGNALYYTNGHYYIELVGSDESTGLFQAMTEVRDNLRTKLAVDKVTKIAELSLFPPENIVQGSAKLYLSNAFGFGALTSTFAARYNLDDQTATVFFSKRANTSEAQTLAQSFYNFLIDNGGVAIIVSPAGKFTGKIVNLYGSIEIVFTTGPFVAGIHGADNQQLAEKLALTLFDKLNQATKAKQSG